ncbi:MAG: PEPxxWA-CTERM sorting domain-containing protein [Phenylobacterium sp.]
MKSVLLAAVAAVAIAGSAHAAISVDGIKDAAYGAATAHVGFDANAPEGNFGAPTNVSDSVAYDIYLHDEGGTLYGFLQADGPTNLLFSNLYFDLNPAAQDGSDLGFEIGNNDAFVPGVSGSVTPLAGMTYATGTNSFEFSISNSYFTTAIPGLTSYPLAAPGGEVVLRLSQSFGYSVAGGATYGPDRLGAFTLAGGVPEPASWAMMILGFLGAGAALRANRRKGALAA